MKKIIIVDGNSLANRAFYAMPYLSNRRKEPSGAVFGFANLLVKLISSTRPDYIAVAFDHARKTFRNEIYADYKAKRKETPPDLVSQFPVIKKMLDVMDIKVFEKAGIEADDIIGTISRSSGIENILVSGDRDLFQLINSTTSVWLTRKGVTETELFDESNIQEKYGVSANSVVDLKALMGDQSDNIPGVAGVGEKTALSLIQENGSLEGVYENISSFKGSLKEKLEAGKNDAYMSKQLATIKTDCDIGFNLQDCEYLYPFSQEVKEFFEDWDFKSLVARKDIFGQIEKEKTQAAKICLKSLQDVTAFKAKIQNVLSYDLENMEFSVKDGEVYFIEKEISLFADTVDFNDALREMKDVFEDENVLKITNSSKQDIKILKGLGICLKNFFDLEIAKYVLFAGLPKAPLLKVEEFQENKDVLLKQMQDEGVLEIYSEIEIPLVKILADMEEEGFKINEAELDILQQKYEGELSSLSQQIYALAGETFNINSPKQVASILFDKLGLKSFNNKKQSTSFAILDEMRWQHEIVELIISHRKLSKLISTYINVYKRICDTSGPVVHTIFNQTLTSTGRLSSSEPNMQNIPTRNEEGRNLRKIFISKYDDGEIISADYNQIELRLLANMAQEESMIDAYKHGVDIHAKTASEIFGVPVSSVTPEQRRDAKAVNFGIIYGISDFGLSQNIKSSRNKAKNYIENYFNRYPKIKVFMDKNVNFAKEHGFVRSYFGRIRHIPEIKASNGMTRKFGERVAMNMPLQGTASDIIKKAMVEISKHLVGMKSHVILQIHDELIVDAPGDEVEKVKSILKECMENVCNFEVPLTVSVGSGKNLFECK